MNRHVQSRRAANGSLLYGMMTRFGAAPIEESDGASGSGARQPVEYASYDDMKRTIQGHIESQRYNELKEMIDRGDYSHGDKVDHLRQMRDFDFENIWGDTQTFTKF